MAGEARAYYSPDEMAYSDRAYSSPSRRRVESPSRQPRIEVHPGQGRRADSAQYARVMSIFKIAGVALALVAVIAVARIWFTSATMDVLTQSDAVASSIEDARQQGSSLEMQYYSLANPSKVKEYASTSLGMSANTEAAVVIDFTPSFVGSSVTGAVEKAQLGNQTLQNQAAAAAAQQQAQFETQQAQARAVGSLVTGGAQ